MKTLRQLVGFDLLYETYSMKARAEFTLTLEDLPPEELSKVIRDEDSPKEQDEAIDTWVDENLPPYLDKEACWEVLDTYIRSNHTEEAIQAFVTTTNEVYGTLSGLEQLVHEAFNVEATEGEVLQ